MVLVLGGDLLAFDFELLIGTGSGVELVLFHQDLLQIQLILDRREFFCSQWHREHNLSSFLRRGGISIVFPFLWQSMRFDGFPPSDPL